MMTKDELNIIKTKLLDRTNKLVRQLEYLEKSYNKKQINNLEVILMSRVSY